MIPARSQPKSGWLELFPKLWRWPKLLCLCIALLSKRARDGLIRTPELLRAVWLMRRRFFGSHTSLGNRLQDAAAQASPPPPNPEHQLSRGHGRAVAAFAVPSYAAGAREAYTRRYVADLARVQSMLPPESRWIDTHCHLESILYRTWPGGKRPRVMDNEEPMDLLALVESWPPGLEACICNIAFQRLSESWGRMSEWEWLTETLPVLQPGTLLGSKIWFTIGIHPSDADRWGSDAERHMCSLLSHPRCVGIGECGLDFSFDHKGNEADLQLRAFRAQASLAVETGKALVVHARQAEQLCFQVLSETVPPDHPIHVHCYSDSLEHALQLCDVWENLRIGFTGCITFALEDKGKSKGRGSKGRGKSRDRPEHFAALVQGLPLSRLLIETDGPYMCPEPFRGQTAHPGHVHRVAERIAQLKGVPLATVMAVTRESCRTVYGI
ncbi:unnamed protein product [Prorocentrum cordatum]|uniref:Uncharacterized protein n=1 Tax=Prorocentrum cordatum TaxID=2364126 RepID=A0ABN9WGR8_9DINO|nr:unnamed protein product [Polarella glacialis]